MWLVFILSRHCLSLLSPLALGFLSQQRLPPAGTRQVQVWRLAQRCDTVSSTGVVIIICGAVPRASVVPDGQVILAPLEAHLGVVVLRDQVEEVREEEVGLIAGHAVDALGETTVDIDGLPPSDGCISQIGLVN